MKVFLSYARELAGDIKKVAAQLRARNHDVFHDESTLPPGTNYHDRIKKGVEECDLFVWFISPESVETGRYTLTELEYAKKRWPSPANKVLPVMGKPTKLESVDPYITENLNILAPKGNFAVEVCAAIDEMRASPEFRKRRVTLKTLAIGTVVTVGLVIVGLILVDYEPGPGVDPPEPLVTSVDPEASEAYDAAVALVNDTRLLERERNDKAVDALEEAIEIDDGFDEAHRMLAGLLKRKSDSLPGESDARRELLERALGHYLEVEGSAEINTRIGEIQLAIGKLDSDCDRLELANRNNETPQSLYAVGDCQASVGDYEGAESHFREALRRLDDGDSTQHLPEAKWGLAEVLWISDQVMTNNQRQRDVVETVRSLYESAIEETPSCFDLHFTYGWTLFETRDNAIPRVTRSDLESARTQYEEALKKKPGSIEVQIELGRVLLTLYGIDRNPTTLQSAERWLEKAQELEPDSARVAILLSSAWRRARRPDKLRDALPVLRAAIERSPNEPELYAALSYVYKDRLCAEAFGLPEEECAQRQEEVDDRAKELRATQDQSASADTGKYRSWPCRVSSRER